MKRLAMAALVGLGGVMVQPALAQQPQSTGTSDAEIKALMAQLEALKASYAKEVRRLRELDMQVQAIQARVSGKLAPATEAPAAVAQSRSRPRAMPVPHRKQSRPRRRHFAAWMM